MTDPARHAEPDLGPGGGPPPTPRWVKAFGILLAALLVAFVALHLAGRGLGHLPSGNHDHPAASEEGHR